MVNFSKIIKMAENLRGTKASFTMGKEALRRASGEAGKKGEAIFDFATRGLKDPAVDVAYKASKQGFTVATATIRDGKKVIGKGAVSITGAGTEQSVIKYKLNIGENGNMMQHSGWLDNAQQLTLDDITTTTIRKGGVTKQTTSIGEAAASRTQFNENEFVKAVDNMTGMPVASSVYEQGKGQIQHLVDKAQQALRDLFAGKEVTVSKNKFGNILEKVKNRPQTPKFAKVKVSQKQVDEILNRKAIKLEHDIKNVADCIKVPSGKDVPLKEYEEAIKSMVNAAEHAPDNKAKALLKEAKYLKEYAEKQNLWDKLENHETLDAIFKLFKL